MKRKLMKNKLLSLVLAAAVFAGTFSPVMAAAPAGAGSAPSKSDISAEGSQTVASGEELPPEDVDPEDPAIAAQTDKEKRTGAGSADAGQAGGIATISAAAPFFGIDVSKYQKTIDWAKAKKAGVRFAFIRVAYAGMKTGKVFEDKYFEKNIQNAHKAGIKTGVYIYSQAANDKEAQKEANFVIEKLRPYKSYINMPVAWDMESPNKKYKDNEGEDFYPYWWTKMKSHTANWIKSQTKISWLAFAKAIKAAGYTPAFYSNTNWVYNYMDMAALQNDGYPFWLAEYNKTPSTFKKHFGTKYKYDFWQFTSSKKVSGISGNVDADYWYSADINLYTPKSYKGRAVPKASSVGTNTATVSWDPVSEATKYVLTLKTGSKTVKREIAQSSKRLSYKLTGLSDGVKYSVTIVPYKNGTAGYSASVSFTTKIIPYTGKVTIKGTNYTSSASVRWGKAKQATKYAVQTSTNKKTWKNYKTVKSCKAGIYSLSNGTAKYIRVIPYKSSRAGKASNVILVHGKFNYTVRDSRGWKMAYKLGSKYYRNSKTAARGKVKVTAKTKVNVNLRRSSSVRSKRVTTIRKGRTVTVLKQGSKWNKVKYGRKTGYMYKKYLR